MMKTIYISSLLLEPYPTTTIILLYIIIYNNIRRTHRRCRILVVESLRHFFQYLLIYFDELIM